MSSTNALLSPDGKRKRASSLTSPRSDSAKKFRGVDLVKFFQVKPPGDFDFASQAFYNGFAVTMDGPQKGELHVQNCYVKKNLTHHSKFLATVEPAAVYVLPLSGTGDGGAMEPVMSSTGYQMKAFTFWEQSSSRHSTPDELKEWFKQLMVPAMNELPRYKQKKYRYEFADPVVKEVQYWSDIFTDEDCKQFLSCSTKLSVEELLKNSMMTLYSVWPRGSVPNYIIEEYGLGQEHLDPVDFQNYTAWILEEEAKLAAVASDEEEEKKEEAN